MKKALTRIIQMLAAGCAGAMIMGLGLFIWYLDSRDDLSLWHTLELNEEFTAESELANFSEYLALEQRLFRELNEEIYDRSDAEGTSIVRRYDRGSLADPARWDRNWNRSFILGQPGAAQAVVLMHGMSDSPYSMRSIAEAYANRGAYVLGLRIPGHGTIPSGLVQLDVDDMRAAVRLAIAHAVKQNPGADLQLVGYSNGAALALDYTLDSLTDLALVRPDRLVLLSPMIGIARGAVLAEWQAELGTLLGLDKLAWNEIMLEYDPYKYNSFAINAAVVTYRLTVDIQEKLANLASSSSLSGMPPILAFSSAVDATVVMPTSISALFDRLNGEHYELVLFDVNRRALETKLLSVNPQQLLGPLEADAQRPFTLSVIANTMPNISEVSWWRWTPGSTQPSQEVLGLAWPDDIYSLSHIALPFPPEDPLYGAQPPENGPDTIHLGSIAMRGERGVLRIPPGAMLRQHWNPFHSWMIDYMLGDEANLPVNTMPGDPLSVQGQNQ